jgi:hypothetical protein
MEMLHTGIKRPDHLLLDLVLFKKKYFHFPFYITFPFLTFATQFQLASITIFVTNSHSNEGSN